MAKGNGQQPIFKLRAKRYKCPSGLTVRSFVMRQLDGADDIEAAMAADARAGSAVAPDSGARQLIDVREKLRLALVEVDGQRVNVGGVPYMGFDRWSLATIRFAERAFVELNLVRSESADAFFDAAEEVDIEGLAPPAAGPEPSSG